jgi:hypothetical protein
MADVEYVEGAEGDHGPAGHVDCSLWIASLELFPPTLKALLRILRPLPALRLAQFAGAETYVHVASWRSARAATWVYIGF